MFFAANYLQQPYPNAVISRLYFHIKLIVSLGYKNKYGSRRCAAGHPSHQECRYSRRAVFRAWGVRDDPFPVSHTGATALLALVLV